MSPSLIYAKHQIMLMSIVLVSGLIFSQLINCQRLIGANGVGGGPGGNGVGDQPPAPPPPPLDTLAPQSNQLAGQQLGAESRGEPGMNVRGGNYPIDQLVNLLSSYASQQLSQNQQRPRQQQQQPPLPLSGVNIPMRLPQQQQQQPPQTSTPINQFLSSTGNPIQFVNNNNINRQRGQNQAQNQLFIPSSSPPTPYLPLNRIPNFGSNPANNNNQNTRQQAPFNMQPINTIPLGAQYQNQINTNNNNNRLLPGRLIPPQLQQRGMPASQQQPIRGNNNNNNQPQQQQQQQQMNNAGQRPQVALPQAPPLAPQQQQQQQNLLKPSGGFAPSGPPPSLGNANNAIVLVQSPSNAIGQQQVSPPPQTSSTDGSASNRDNKAGDGGDINNNNNNNSAENKQPDISETQVSSTQTDAPAISPSTMNSDKDNTQTSPAATTTLSVSSTSDGANNTTEQGGSSSTKPSVAGEEAASSEQSTQAATTTTGAGLPSSTPSSSSWNPVEANNNRLAGESSQKNKVLAPTPDIVTVPPGYNPDQPNPAQSYDISVSAQMGGTGSSVQRPAAPAVTPSDLGSSSSEDQSRLSVSSAPSAPPTVALSPSFSSTATTTTPTLSVQSSPPIGAPTAVTTIFWSPPPSTTINGVNEQQQLMLETSTVNKPTTPSSVLSIKPSKTLEARSSPPVQSTNYQSSSSSSNSPSPPPTRIRDNSLLQGSQQKNSLPNVEQDAGAAAADPGVVYGKPQTRDQKPQPPNQQPQSGSIAPSPMLAQASIETSMPPSGRPFIQPVQIDNQVRPYLAGAGPLANQPPQQHLFKSNNQHSAPPFKASKPLNGQKLAAGASSGQSPMQVGSGFVISGSGNQTMPTGDIQDYVAGQPPLLLNSSPSTQQQSGLRSNNNYDNNNNYNNEPTISAQGGQDPANFDLNTAGDSGQSFNGNTSSMINNNDSPLSTQAPPIQIPAHRVRRPTFKPKPALPPIRIDSCIVGDDSSCDQSHNERCVTEYGISSCHCKPGYARLSQLRGYCSPVSLLQLNMKIDKLSDDRKLAYNHTLDNSNSEEYQYLEFETIQAIASAFQQSQLLGKQFMGARVNKFFERKGKVWVNVSINFEANNVTKTEKIQQVASQELAKVMQSIQKQSPNQKAPLGDSTIVVDGVKESISKLVDVNECSQKELNDCSKYATCSNDFGTFQCQCLAGYEDKYKNDEDKNKHGRVCLGCSPSYCSNRGECSITNGQKQCKCRPNFIGARCDIDSEVLAVAVGGSLVGIIILIITFWCLFVFNRRWKREQQKLDAMSATSGLTFNYVNSSTNSLMSPNGRSGGFVNGAGGGGGGGGLHRSGGHQVAAMANYGQRFGAALANGSRAAAGGHYSADQQAIIGSTSSGSSASSQAINCNQYGATGYQYEDAGLLIAPASTGSSEQTSPSSNSYRGIIGANLHNHHHHHHQQQQQAMLSQLQAAGNAYTLSGHHHHHHHAQLHHHHNSSKHHQPTITQFHPAAATDYRTLNTTALTCPAGQYDSRWRTLQQDPSSNKQQLVGYYLSPDMLVNQHQQQMYASPQRELCIDTGNNAITNNKTKKQQGRANNGGGFNTLRSRSQGHHLPRNTMYRQNADHYDHERPI